MPDDRNTETPPTNGAIEPRRPGPSWAETVFIGPRGLRAGWRLLLYLIVVFIILELERVALLPFRGRLQALPRMTDAAFKELSAFIAVAGAALLMGRIERRPFGEYGLPARHAFGRLFWTGAVWGFAALSILLLVLRGLHGFYFGHVDESSSAAVHYGLLWLVGFTLVALSEEFTFRGYTLYTLAQGIHFWPAAAVLSALFGMVHLGNAGEDWRGALAAAFIGLFFCFTVRRTGTLWFAVGMHAFWDYGESFVYSTPDSGIIVPGHLLGSSFHGPNWLTGGRVGPEGSVLVFPVIAMLFLTFALAYPKRRSAGLAR